MDKTDLDKLFGPDPEEPEAAPEAQAPETPDENAGPSPAVEPEPQEQAEPPKSEAPAPQKEADPERVPISALLDERRKRQALEARLLEARKAEKPAEGPDPLRDPEGFARAMREEQQAAAREATIGISRRFAVQTHGEEAVNAATIAFVEAGQAARARGEGFGVPRDEQADPVGYVVRWHAEQKARAEIGDPLTYEQRLREKILAELQAQQPAAPAQAPKPALPKALGPSAGAVTHKGAKSDKDALFERFSI